MKSLEHVPWGIRQCREEYNDDCVVIGENMTFTKINAPKFCNQIFEKQCRDNRICMKFNPGIETPYYSKHTKNWDNRVNGCDDTAAQRFRCWLHYISISI